MSEPLHMLRFELSNRWLLQFEHLRGLPRNHDDIGYIVHMLFVELFGKEFTPRPFLVRPPSDRMVTVLAYSKQSLDELREQAELTGDPLHITTVQWERCAGKAMPKAVKPGTKLWFSARVCPVQRFSSPVEKNGRTFRGDVDTFVWATAGRLQTIHREDVYARWTRDQLAYTGAVEANSAYVQKFGFTQMIRRTQPDERGNRVAKIITLPDALVSGEIVVKDTVRFQELLRHGFGRHRGFGYGMLLLKAIGS